jgi:hypothetical protein
MVMAEAAADAIATTAKAAANRHKSEIRSTKSETNSKLEISNPDQAKNCPPYFGAL